MSFYKWKDKLRNTNESSLKLLIMKGHIEKNNLNEGLMDRLILGKNHWAIQMKGLISF